MNDNNFTHRFPQYLSKPIQVLWFETDELIICCLHPHPGPYLRQNHVACFSGHPIFLYPDQDDQNPEGFSKHILYMFGFIQMKNYPEYFQREFHE